MEPDAVQSYTGFHVSSCLTTLDIPAENYFIPDGTLPQERINE
jgi:glucosamine-6-phosphate deaminase